MLPDGPAVADDTARAIHTIILKLKLENCSKNRNFGNQFISLSFFLFLGTERPCLHHQRQLLLSSLALAEGLGDRLQSRCPNTWGLQRNTFL